MKSSAFSSACILVASFLLGLPISANAQVTFEQKSNPAGLFTSTSVTKNINDSISTITPSLTINEYSFTHWTLNDVRENAPDGQAKNKISSTITENTVAIAHYLATNQDSDSDGVPDWFEIRMFATLDHNGSYDGDGDGVTLAEERQFGLAATIADDFLEGGASIRRSGLVFANFGGAKKLSVSSDPAGLFTSSETFPETNSSYSSTNLNGLTNGYYFSHWEVNGVRQADSKGIGLSKISLTMNEDKTVVAKYYHQNEDTDSDGLPDWFEWHEFGTLDHNSSSDPDGDGLLMSEERQFGLSAVIADDFLEGGGSIRRSGTIGYIEFQPNEDDDGDGLTKAQELQYGTSDDNTDSDGDGFPDGEEVAYGSSPTDANSIANGAPVDLNLSNNFSFMENLPIGSIIGDFNGTDPDGDQMTYFLISGLGDGNNSLFSLETNGSLKTATTFDFETNSSNYSIRVQAKDSYNQIYDANFTLTLLDDIQEDTDKDGYPDFIELEQGSDFEDNSSFPGTDYRNADLGDFSSYNKSEDFLYANFQGKDLFGANLSSFIFKGANFTDANLSKTNLAGADFNRSNLTRVNLTSAWYSSTTIWPFGFAFVTSGAWGPGADFRNLNLDGFNASFKGNIQNSNFSGVNLSGKGLHRADFSRSNFENANLGSGDRRITIFNLCNLRNAKLNGGNYSSAKFIGSDLSNAEFINANIASADFSGANLSGVDFNSTWFSQGTVWPENFDVNHSGAIGPGIDFTSLNISNLDMKSRDLTRSIFKGVDLTNKDLQGSNLSLANLSDANLNRTVITGTNFSDANLSGATFYGAWFSSSTIWPKDFAFLKSGAFGPGVDFTSLDLSSFNAAFRDINNSNFEDLNVSGKNFHRANLSHSNLENTILSGGDKRFSFFDFSNLKNANFEGSNLYNFSAKSADLRGANFSNCSFGVPVLTNSIFDINTIWPNGFDPVAAGAISRNNPKDLNSTAVLAVQENQPVGTIIGEFNATDPDGDAITYHFVNGENNNSMFTLDTNGTLKTATVFDYESNASSYTITVQVKDELNATTDGNFTVTLLDVYEPFRENHTVELNASVGMEMIWVNPGTFTMGQNNIADSSPEHNVTLTEGFYLGKYEMTQAQYEAVVLGNSKGLNPNPSNRGGLPNHPVEMVSFNNINTFLDLLSTQNPEYIEKGWRFVLPTSAQWEFACRAGTPTQYFWGETIEVGNANYHDNGLQTTRVGFYESNHWGFHDMHGNVAEFVSDWHGSYQSSPKIDPTGPKSGTRRMFRGGSWRSTSDQLRSAARMLVLPQYTLNYVGFRLVLKKITEQPTNLNSTAVLSFSENQQVGTIIGEFNATDPDGDAITYHFVNGENNNSFFILDTNGTLKTATAFDYESNASSYTITVQAKDELNATTESSFTITLLDDKSDNPPSDLWLSNAQINENTAVGTEVAQIVPLDKKYSYKAGQGIGSHVVILRNASHMGVQFIKGEVLNVTLIGNGGTVNGVTIYRPQVNKGPTWLPLTGRGDWWQRVFPGVSLVLESGNEGVSLDGQTGMLSVNRIFDYETDGASHSFSVRAQREGMHDFNKFFSLTITDIFEDLDQDGTADHLDDDIDGDGFTNTEELAYGSDPLDPNSVANAPPFITLKHKYPEQVDKNGVFHIRTPENQKDIIQVTATDFDKDDLNFSIYGWQDLDNFEINASTGSLRFKYAPDFENPSDHDTNNKFGIVLRVSDGKVHHDQPVFIHVDNQNEPPFDLNTTISFRVLENQPVGTMVGKLTAKDQDEGEHLIYSLVRDRDPIANEFFTLDENGTLRTAEVLDYEKNASLFIRAKVTDKGGLLTKNGFVVEVINIVEDLDRDGTEDHLDDDIDGDGFTNEEELAYGSNPLDENSVANVPPVITLKDEYPEQVDKNGVFHIRTPENQKDIIQVTATDFDKDDLNFSIYGWQDLDHFEINASTGSLKFKYAPNFEKPRDHDTDNKFGIVLRVSDGKAHQDQPLYIYVDNQNEPPFDLNTTTPIRVLENQPVGTMVGKLTAKDQDEGEHLIYSLVRDRDPLANEFFALDENGTLRTAEVLDHEKNASLFIRARVTDKGGLLTKNGFVVEVINIIEDKDGDGTEDAYDEDIDGDGFSNRRELTYGSDPLDPNSVANAGPNSLDLNGSTILENQPKGTIIGRLIGHDPDTNATLVYSQVLEGNQTQSPVHVGPAGVVRTTRVFDYETNDHNYTLVARVSDEHNFSIERSFTIYLLNQIEDMDEDGVEDFYDEDIDGDGFSNEEEIAYGSDPWNAQSVINAPPTDITMQGGEVEENQPAGTLVGRFFGVDADKNDSLTYRMFDPVSGEGFPFKLSQRGGLRTIRKLDYELDEHNYSLTVRVVDDMNKSFDKSFTVILINQVEDLDGDGIEDAYDEDIDGDGYSNEQEISEETDPGNQYSHSNKPILRTLRGVLNDDGSIDLNGSVLSDGQGQITDFGFVISSGISIDPKKSKVLWIRGVGEPEGFKLNVSKSPFEKVLYFRAWAKNIAGYGIGPVKKVIIPEGPKPWWGDVDELEGGWKSSDWFGTFKYYEQGWLYHARLGWLFSSPASDGSVWLWKDNRGWLWTKEDIYPYMWSDQTGNWIYIYPGKTGEALKIFDYSTQSYK